MACCCSTPPPPQPRRLSPASSSAEPLTRLSTLLTAAAPSTLPVPPTASLSYPDPPLGSAGFPHRQPRTPRFAAFWALPCMLPPRGREIAGMIRAPDQALTEKERSAR